MEAPLSREERRKLKKKERKRKQRQWNAASRNEKDRESDNEKDSESDNKSCEKRQRVDEKEAVDDPTPSPEEFQCCMCKSEDVRYRCDDCNKVYCVNVLLDHGFEM